LARRLFFAFVDWWLLPAWGMASLVFDIETSALPREQFDEAQLEYLFRPAERLEHEAEREAKREEIGRMFNLWPFTAQCVCICMINADSGRGKVLYISDDYEADSDGPVEFVACMDEAEVLTGFWEAAKKYDQMVTFNGRGFDVPFIYLRSALLDIPISRKDLLGYRFATSPHCDLADQLTFYSVGGRDGAARRFNLDFYCKVFGIDSPKAEGVTGMDVNDLMADERYHEIAKYCVRDVVATTRLFQIWKARLAGTK
jgi:DNA polymerase elongation subunit (family B)